MAKFRKKPVVIEAMQFTGTRESAYAILEWAGPNCGMETVYTSIPKHPVVVMVATLEGAMRAVKGDWIIKGVKEEFYPCKPDIFEATYDPVTE